MLHQLIFSGHVKKEANKVAIAADAQMACDVCEMHNVKGLTLFSDGTFISILEGEEHNNLAVFENIKNQDRFSHTHVILTRKSSEAEFDDYKIGFRDKDFSKSVSQSFLITSQNLAKAIPSHLSGELKILIQTFARVNNLETRLSAA